VKIKKEKSTNSPQPPAEVMKLNNNKIYWKPNEPHMVKHEWDYKFMKDNGIEIFVTGNLLAKNNEGDEFQYVCWNYFLDFPYFGSKQHDFKYNFINEFDFKYKILCYNRRAHAHRKILVYNILQNELLKDNTLFSLGYEQQYNDKITKEIIAGYTENLEEANDIFNYFTNLKEDISFDKNINLNRDIIGKSFVLDDYKKTFVSLVTETLASNDTLFFSEKTYKPIAAQHPFIILGNPNSLKYLKSIGFKTFDKWWDESYDEESNFKIRLEKIICILKDICNKPFEELYKIRKEMNDVCIYNYKHFLKSTGVTDELKKLGCEPQIINDFRTKLI
jgi:hypothetical protein